MAVLYVEGEFILTLFGANHANLFFRRNGITKLEPDIRIIERDLGEADGSTADALFDLIDRDADGRVAVYPIRVKTRSFDRRLECVGVSLVEAPTVKWLDTVGEVAWSASISNPKLK